MKFVSSTAKIHLHYFLIIAHFRDIKDEVMMLDNPLVNKPLRSLRSLVPEPDLRGMSEVDSAATSDSQEDSEAGSHVRARPAAGTKLALARAFRLFGGVIIGAAAEEISRSFTHVDDSDAYADSDRESICDSLGSPANSGGSLEHKHETSTPASQRTQKELEVSKVCHDEDAQSQQRTVGGLKRKFGQVDVEGSKRRNHGVAKDEATPPAPKEREAVKVVTKGRDLTSFVSECNLPTEKGQFRLRAYRYRGEDKSHEPVVMIAGDIRGREAVPVRVHDQCQTSEVLGSKRCDCREQLDLSLRYIQENGGGAVIYLQQEGRGIGLANKVAAYALQDTGLDTVDANRRLGFHDDERSYECVDFILRDMGVKSVKLMTNNPFKMDWLRSTGVDIVGRIPVQVPSNEHNQDYLQAKAQRMSHLLDGL